MENESNYENVFYRATDNLPHVKCLYIDAMIYMPYRVDEFIRTMSDRDLRVRTPIEEIRMLLDAPPGENEMEPEADSEEEVIVIKEDQVKQERNRNTGELSPDRLADFEEEGDQYDSIPAYEAPHMREEDRKHGDRKRRRKRGVQYPDPEFNRRWEKKRRDAEEQKEREREDKRRKREEERARRFSRYEEENDSDDKSIAESQRSRNRRYSSRQSFYMPLLESKNYNYSTCYSLKLQKLLTTYKLEKYYELEIDWKLTSTSFFRIYGAIGKNLDRERTFFGKNRSMFLPIA